VLERREDELTAESLVIISITVGKPHNLADPDVLLESRPGGIWISRKRYTGNINETLTDIDILFGVDAVDPRPQWHLMPSPLQLNTSPDLPVARLSIHRGAGQSRVDDPPPALQVDANGIFKIVQISDTHMVTGIGTCKDAIDADGRFLPPKEADPLTVKFLGEVLDVEKPDLVLLTGDQVHHDIPDSQSALFKIVAPLIERKIPYAAVFGNHDSEGAHALSREQSPFLQTLEGLITRSDRIG